jgi:MFS family permease
MAVSALPGPVVARPGVVGLLRHPVPRLLWAGQVASVAGDRLYAVALVWVALTLTHAPGAVAGVMLADSIPFLLASSVSGWLADRHDGLRLARGVDVARAVAVAVLPALSVFGWLSLPALVAVAVVLSALDAFFLPAVQATLPRLVEPGGLTPMVSLLDSTDRLGRVLGPGLVGLFAFLPEIHLFSLDAVTFLISAGTLTAIHRRTSASSTDFGSPRRDRVTGAALLAGWRATLSRHELRDALLLRTACNLAWPVFTLAVPFLITARFRHGIGGYGLVLAAFGLGNVVGTLLAARVPRPWLSRVCCLAWAGAGLGFAALGSASSYALFLAAAAAIGVCTPLANVTVNAAIAASLPHDLLARAYAAQRFAVVAAGTAGLPAAAALISRLGATTALYVAAALIGAAAVLGLVSTTPRRTGRARAVMSRARVGS